ncbi:hypothetical protein ACHWQZ_G006572 [Mnemiopsis leidyi]
MTSTICRCILLMLFLGVLSAIAKKPKALRMKMREKRLKRRYRQLEKVDGGYSDWTPFSHCNLETCTETWTRYCNNPRPRNGGKTCVGLSFKKERCRDDSKCVTETAPPTANPNGGEEQVEAQWSRWGPCSVSCGVGIRTRVMLPCDDGEECERQEQPCIKKSSCSDKNGYGDWTEWSGCENCVQTRTRTCERAELCGFKEESESRQCLECDLDPDAMTECQRTLHDHIKYSRSGYRVECTEDGMFAARQCDSSVEKCWCAERTTGRMIYGTYHASHMVGPYDCENLSTMTRCKALEHVGNLNVVASDWTPQCDRDGNFYPLQLDEETATQWCVYRDGLEVPGTKVSFNDALACDPAVVLKTKCQATKGADCTPQGDFSYTQCEDAREGQVCRCVYSNGLTKASTELFAEIPHCNAYPDLSLTKCQAMSLMSPTVTCLPSGEYAPEHCNKEVCYCIYNDGSIVPGTGSPVSAIRRTSCEDLIKMNNGPEELDQSTTPMQGVTPGGDQSSTPTRETPQETSSLLPDVATFSTSPTPGGMLTTSSMEGPGSLMYSPSIRGGTEEPYYVEYGEWSEWSECSAECGGGSRSRSRVCPTPNGACGGPDVAMIFDVCNDIRCIEAHIESLEYEWTEDSKEVTVTCAAIGLPKPFVVIRDNEGFITEDNQIEALQVDGTIVVKYRFGPRADTRVRCFATIEENSQDRIDIVVVVQPARVSSFTTSSPAIYLGQELTLRCSVTGLPRPDIRLLRNGEVLEETSSAELVAVVTPEFDTEYSCAAFFAEDEEVSDMSEPLTVVVVDPCQGVECQDHALCEILEDGNTTCTCKTCDLSDLETADPICGNDCVTYMNSCDMERASCLLSTSLYSIFDGPCSVIEAPVVTGTCPENVILEGTDILLECTASGIWDTAVWTKDGQTVGRGRRLRLSGVSTTDSGLYKCIVTGCGGTSETSCQVSVKKKDTETCMQYGAGHFHQFSGAKFNYPGVCHYVLAMDCHFGSFYIYTGTSQCGSEETPLAYASSVTVYVGWDAVVLLRGFDVNEFGVMKHLGPGKELHYQNFRIWRERDIMYLTHPATNFTLGWDGLTVVTLTMSKTYAGRLCGLCGDVGVEFNEVEDPQSHASSYEVDRYDRCNIADVPLTTWSTQEEYDDAYASCYDSLYSETLSRCHGVVPVEEYLENCIYDTNGVKWLESYKTGMCNVLSAYSIACQGMGVQVAGWRDDTPCPRERRRSLRTRV